MAVSTSASSTVATDERGAARRLPRRVVCATLLLALAACLPSPDERAPAPSAPHLRILGTAQDGGFPHAACACSRCVAAREDPRLRRRVASLAICLPASRRVYLVDATPDLREQLVALEDLRRHGEASVDRAPVDGIFLTHAHIGHYLGLALLGFEAVHARGIPVHCTARMGSYLRDNAPWDQLVRLGNVVIHEIRPGDPVALGEGVSVEAFPVPHRDEYGDTVGFRIEGDRSTVLYVPDTDRWETWTPSLLERLEGVDVAILDGTFYSADELPGRDVTTIGHPLITTSMDLLQPLVDRGGLRVHFTHLNHSNPALEPDGPARDAIRRRGFHVLADGDVVPL